MLDGRVNRAKDGTEIRYPVVLTMPEKKYARKIVRIFGQNICGFDLLRADCGSFVCDVNGWSFVKKSTKYYEDSSVMLRALMLAATAPWMLRPDVATSQEEQGLPDGIAPPAHGQPDGDGHPDGDIEELRCVVVVARHGDRSPKQKVKVKVRHPLFMDLLAKFGKGRTTRSEVKLKKVKQLTELLDVVRTVLKEAVDPVAGCPPLRPEVVLAGGEGEERDLLVQVRSSLERFHFSGINRKAQLKPVCWDEEGVCTSVLLVMKWGGELTPAGRVQAEDLGGHMRNLYVPYTHSEDYGAGLLRLHSTYRHDFKVYSSDEGRVMMSAAAFTKGLLALEGALTPILVSLVHRDEAMLDESQAADGVLAECKLLVRKLMLESPQTAYTPESAQEMGLQHAHALVPATTVRAMVKCKNPREQLARAYELIRQVIDQMRAMMVADGHEADRGGELTVGGQTQVYNAETVAMMFGRWIKLHQDFFSKKKGFDLSKVPDLYDCVKYDAIHNSKLQLSAIPELFYTSKHLADVVIPQEYGVTALQKVDAARKIGSYMFRVIAHHLRWAKKEPEDEKDDEMESMEGQRAATRLDTSYGLDSLLQGLQTPDRQVRTRIYMTSESHIHALHNLLRFAKKRDGTPLMTKRGIRALDDAPELNFLSHFVFKVFERRKDGFLRVEVRFSAGANESPMDFYNLDEGALAAKVSPNQDEDASVPASPSAADSMEQGPEAEVESEDDTCGASAPWPSGLTWNNKQNSALSVSASEALLSRGNLADVIFALLPPSHVGSPTRESSQDSQQSGQPSSPVKSAGSRNLF